MTVTAVGSVRRQTWWQVCVGSAGVALVFSIFVAVEMLQIWRHMQASNPLDHPHLIALRSDLAREPDSDALKEEIRREEVALRERFLTND